MDGGRHAFRVALDHRRTDPAHSFAGILHGALLIGLADDEIWLSYSLLAVPGTRGLAWLFPIVDRISTVALATVNICEDSSAGRIGETRHPCN